MTEMNLFSQNGHLINRRKKGLESKNGDSVKLLNKKLHEVLFTHNLAICVNEETRTQEEMIQPQPTEKFKKRRDFCTNLGCPSIWG